MAYTKQAVIILIVSIAGLELTKAENIFGKVLADIVQHYAGKENPFSASDLGFDDLTNVGKLDNGVPGPTVGTSSGTILGSLVPEANAFYSIPYATPPVGSLRFRNPAPIKASQIPINATVSDMVVCHQIPHEECYPSWCYTNQKEDCLVLNVHSPRTVDLSDPDVPPTNRLPVFLWIHGGAFFAGSGTSPSTEGRWLSNVTNSIVVSINYRLGAYGFLVYNKGERNVMGNMGLKDQQLALQWVQDNIEKFGGDKDKVTIAGQSAGAQSVMFHLLSPVSRPLFKRAILESNAPVFPHQTPDEAMLVTERLLNVTECAGKEDELQCLIEVDAAKLDQIPAVMLQSLLAGDGWSTVEPYRPVIDGVEFTDQPLTLFQNGKWNTEKEFITGANTQEVEILQFYVPGDIKFNQVMFRAINKLFFGDETGKITAQYYEDTIGPDSEGDYSKVLGIEAGDAFFICTNRAMARFAHDNAENSNYFYIFGHPAEGEYCEAVTNKPETCGYAHHSAEIPFVFRSGPSYGYCFNENDTAVADQLSTYWGSFMHTGNPNTGLENSLGTVIDWPPYEMTTAPGKRSIGDASNANPSHVYDLLFRRKLSRLEDPYLWNNIRIQAPTGFIESNYRDEVCDFWDSLNFYVQFENISSVTEPAVTSATVPSDIKTTVTKQDMNTTSSAKRMSTSFMLIYAMILILASGNT